MENTYDLFITKFAIGFNEIAKKALDDLDSIGINTSKEALLQDLFNELKKQDEASLIPPTPQVQTIVPTIDLNLLPEQSKRNIMDFIDTYRIRPIHVVEITKIQIEGPHYAVTVRTISSNFTTHYFTEEEFIAIINRKPVKEIPCVFTKKKVYNFTIE